MKPHVFKRHQRRAFRYAQSRKRIALFMEQRLGKSPVAIRWAQAKRSKRVLLIAPLSTLLGKLNWQGELNREGIEPVMLPTLHRDNRWHAIRPSRIVPKPPGRYAGYPKLVRSWARGWFCLNYEALRTQPELLTAPWDTIILDESTRIRNPKAQITKALKDKAGHIPNRAILSGLPNPEDPLDYFCQFVFLHGHFMDFDNYWAFRHSHFYTTYTDWDWTPRPKVRDKIKQYVHQHAFVLTRKQAKVGSTKVRGMRTCELNAAQRRVLKEMRTKFEVDGVETKWTTVVHAWMQRVAGGFHPVTLDLLSDAKVRLAEEVIMEEFRHEPVVMWFRFNEEIEYLHRWLKRRNRKLRVSYVHGGIDKKRRPKIQERFQTGDTQIILMQVKLRFGWNLSRSSTAIYYSNTYEYEDRAQSEDRIIHLKKKEPCLYLDLVTRETPDEDVVDALTDKRLNAQSFNRRLLSAVQERARFLAPGERV